MDWKMQKHIFFLKDSVFDMVVIETKQSFHKVGPKPYKIECSKTIRKIPMVSNLANTKNYYLMDSSKIHMKFFAPNKP